MRHSTVGIVAFSLVWYHAMHVQSARLHHYTGAKTGGKDVEQLGVISVEEAARMQSPITHEELIDATKLSRAFPPGTYDLVQDVVVRTGSAMDSDEVAHAAKNTAVHVLEAVYVADIVKVRGLIQYPYGWITLYNAADAHRSVSNRDKFCASVYSCSWHWDKCKGDGDDCVAQEVGFKLGAYDISHGLDISSGVSLDSSAVGKLKAGMAVTVIDIKSDGTSVRGQIKQPPGWITLKDMQAGTASAVNREIFCQSTSQLTCESHSNRKKCYLDDFGCEPQKVEPLENAFKEIGHYDALEDVTVTATIDPSSDVVAELEKGAAFDVIKIEKADPIIRAEIAHPHGWISLFNTASAFEWAQSRQLFCSDDYSCHDRKCSSHNGECVPTNPASDFLLGDYDANVNLDVTSGIYLSSSHVGEIKHGNEVVILSIHYVVSEDKVRAEIARPHGWVTLLDTAADANGTSTLTHRESYCGSMRLSQMCRMHFVRCNWDGERCRANSIKKLDDKFPLGDYDSNEELIVRATIDTTSEKVAILPKGTGVNILKVEYVEELAKVRAEIKHPHGWITLVDARHGQNSTLTNRERFCAGVGNLGPLTTETSRAAACAIYYNTCTWDPDLKTCTPQAVTTTTTTTSTTTTTTTTTSTTTTWNPANAFPLGGYDSIQDLLVRETVDVESEEVGLLPKGTAVNVLKVEHTGGGKVRAEIAQPYGLSGWVTLLNPANGRDSTLTSRENYCKGKSWSLCGLKGVSSHLCYWDKDSNSCTHHLITTTTTTTAHVLAEWNLGVYDIVKQCAVKDSIDLSSTKLATLEVGDEVEVVKVEYSEENTRVRAEIKNVYGIHGWITLRDVSDDSRWAESREVYCKQKTGMLGKAACLVSTVCRWDDGECAPLPLRPATTTTTRQTVRTTVTTTVGAARRTTTTTTVKDKVLPMVEQDDETTTFRAVNPSGGTGAGWIWVVGSFVTVLLLGAIIKVGMTFADNRQQRRDAAQRDEAADSFSFVTPS